MTRTPGAVHRPTLTAALFALALPAMALPAMAAELPPPLEAFAAEQSRVCTALGGAPRVGPAFATAVDLNGDGALDYIVDLAGIECANAWSAFCGPQGCPLSVWLGGAAGPARAWADVAQGWRLEGADADMAVVVDRSGDACPEAEAVVCSERLAFDAAPVAPPAAPVSAAPPAAPLSVVPLQAPGGDGWMVRDVPGATPVAISDGPGAFASVAVFCLAGQPLLAAPLVAAPLVDGGLGETAEIAFAFSGERVAYAARREAGAGGALVIDLADRPLAGLLAGRDSSVRLALDGVAQGTLSLRGSSKAIRDALARCAPG